MKLKRLQAHKGIASSLWLSALALALVSAGCSGGQAQSPAAQSQPVEAPAETLLNPATLVFPASEPQLSLKMQDSEVKLGISQEEAKKLFPRPGRSFPIQDLPSGLDSQFEVSGWEQGPLSIGMISAKGRVALFLEIQEKADEASALERVSEVSSRHGLPTSTIHQGNVRYWFWDVPGERIMICLSPDGSGRFALSCALGHPILMSTMRMSSPLAAEDAAEAEKIMLRQPAVEPKGKG